MTKLQPLSKEFLRKLRLYFSAVSGTRAQYCYFNFFEGVVLSNSCSGGKGETHGDRLMDFTVGELGLHFVKFKDVAFFREFRSVFQVPEREFFCIKIGDLISTLTNNDMNNLEIVQQGNTWVLKIIGVDEIDEKNQYGFIIHNFHVIRVIQKWYNYICQVCAKKELVKSDVDVLVPMENGMYFTTIKIADLGLDKVFKNTQPTVKFLSFDGLTTVSIKSFLKKLNTPYSLKRYLWVDNNLIYSFAVFNDDVARIISIRPNIASMPIISDVKIDISKG